jgi:hypothetical protein
VPQIFVNGGRVNAGFDDTVVLAEQLFERVLADFAEFLVGVDDVAVDVGDADDGMLVERELLVFSSATFFLVCARLASSSWVRSATRRSGSLACWFRLSSARHRAWF